MFVAMNWLNIVLIYSSRSRVKVLVSSSTFPLTSGIDILVVEIVELVGLLIFI
jgi:hypothetical protein